MTPSGRLAYLDAMRGIAVLVMIEAHVIDSWTRDAARATNAFGYSLILGGFGAPLFLFLAGVSVALSAASKARRSGDPRAAARAVQRRGLEIFALAFLFRLQAFVISRSSPAALLTVDILNIMGLAIVATAWLWSLTRSDRGRVLTFATATAALALATPSVRAAAWLSPLPDFLEAYIRPIPHVTNFAIFPWAAFVPAGAIVGVFVHRAGTRVEQTRANAGFAVAGAAIALIAYGASYAPSLVGPSHFWTSSPSFFFIRAGLMTFAIAVAYLWNLRPSAGSRFSPLVTLGRHSLFIYWIHVEMVYGKLSEPLHRTLSLEGAWLAWAGFSALMVGCAVGKDRFDARRRGVAHGSSTTSAGVAEVT